VLHDALTKALAHHPGRMLVIDIDGVTVLDDSGLGVLLGAAGSAREAGADLIVVCNNDRLRDRLDRTGFSRAVEVHSRLPR
jgi:anti-anti-sigma factor